MAIDPRFLQVAQRIFPQAVRPPVPSHRVSLQPFGPDWVGFAVLPVVLLGRSPLCEAASSDVRRCRGTQPWLLRCRPLERVRRSTGVGHGERLAAEVELRLADGVDGDDASGPGPEVFTESLVVVVECGDDGGCGIEAVLEVGPFAFEGLQLCSELGEFVVAAGLARGSGSEAAVRRSHSARMPCARFIVARLTPASR